ncbi:MAG: hypothetical protein WBO17_08010 [Sphingorhabdus sp.]
METILEKIDLERRFYGRMIIAILVVILIGFAPSFYFFQIFSYPRPNPVLTPMVMLHGFVFTAWVAMFYSQTRLVADGRRDLHKQWGIAGFGLAVALIPIMYFTAIQAIPRGTHPPFVDALTWSAVPLLAIPPTALLLFLGWKYRTTPQAHKRFMLIATLGMVEPGIGRWPVFPPTLAGHIASGIVSFAMIIPLLMWDQKTLGRLHWATKIGIGALLFGYYARYFVWNTVAWHDLAATLAG